MKIDNDGIKYNKAGWGLFISKFPAKVTINPIPNPTIPNVKKGILY